MVLWVSGSFSPVSFAEVGGESERLEEFEELSLVYSMFERKCLYEYLLVS